MDLDLEAETPFIASQESASSDNDSDNDSYKTKSKFAPTSLQFVTKFKARCLVRGVVMLMIFLVLAVVFSVGFIIGRFTASTPHESTPTTPTSTCAIPTTAQEDICAKPPVLLISLDGFWNGYFERNITPSLSSLGKDGVQAEFIRSAFPTKTFPNHFTLVTGLYPESHGIVDNNFYDKDLSDVFYIGNNDPKWWLGEPIWVTADKHRLKSGVYFWPGSEVLIQGMHPTYYERYDSSVPFDERVLKILEWLDYPTIIRPQLLTLYLNEPDHSAHNSGPESMEVDAALGRVDEVIEDLIVQLKDRGIYDCINIIVVSDHGMTTSDLSKLFFIQSYIPEEYDVSYSNYGVNMNININDGDNTAVQAVYAALQNISNAPFKTFYLADVPLRMHMGHYNLQRYGDIFLAGDLGSYVTQKSNSQVPMGEHGYDNNEVSMQSIFVAHGPAFKKGYVAPGFDNIQTYNLLCALLNITPSDNNGTFGALHHMLMQNLSDILPPVEIQDGVQGVTVECAMPDAIVCETCFCTHACPADMSHTEVVSDPDEVLFYQSMHLPLGVPSGGQGNGACLLTNKHSVTLYSTTLHIPLWVAFTLTNEMTLQPVDGDTECYQRDPRIPSVECINYNLSLSDYTHTNLAPSSGGAYLPLLSNSVPQLEQYYHMLWSEWENQLMQWSITYGTLHVIMGSLLDSDHNDVRDNDIDYEHWLNGKDSVAIPSGFYSIVSRCVPATTGSCPHSNVEVLGLLLPHKKLSAVDESDSESSFQFHLSTVWDIQSITDINFFPNLSPEQQARLKLHIVTNLWQ